MANTTKPKTRLEYVDDPATDSSNEVTRQKGFKAPGKYTADETKAMKPMTQFTDMDEPFKGKGA